MTGWLVTGLIMLLVGWALSGLQHSGETADAVRWIGTGIFVFGAAILIGLILVSGGL